MGRIGRGSQQMHGFQQAVVSVERHHHRPLGMPPGDEGHVRIGLHPIQRFDNFERALQVLERGVDLARQRPLSELEQQGLIQGFEFSHELAWNLLKDYLQHQGIEGIIGSRDATRLAFQNDLISDGEGWMAMIKARNQSSHTYNLEQAQAIARDVIERYAPLFAALRERFRALGQEVS
jgi:nucleotidyltransferase substrate binding protein (TIGR01987 family)